jgi:hypothetical protein
MINMKSASMGCVLASLLMLTTTAARAKECLGVSFPDRMRVDSSDLALNGLGVRKATFLKVNVYVAALYAGKPSRDPKALVAGGGPDELILHFVRNVGVDDLTKAWNEGFERNSKQQLPALKERITKLNGWMSDMKTGQRLSFIRRPGVGIEVGVDGTAKGTIEGDDFARALLSIWLGETPPNPELKKGLLGGECK